MAFCRYLTGNDLPQRRHHMSCLVVAAINCVPYSVGTVMGALTLLVLIRPRVKKMFGVA